MGTDTLPPMGSWEHRWRHGHMGCVHRHWTDTACLSRAEDTHRTRSLHHCTHRDQKRRKRKEIIRTQTKCSLAASLIQLSVACVENTENQEGVQWIEGGQTERKSKKRQGEYKNHHNVQRHGCALQSIEETDVYFDNSVSSHWICYHTSGQRFGLLDWLCSVRQMI